MEAVPVNCDKCYSTALPDCTSLSYGRLIDFFVTNILETHKIPPLEIGYYMEIQEMSGGHQIGHP